MIPQGPLPAATGGLQTKVGIKRPAQKAQGLVFHGLRHWFVSQLRGTLPDHVVQALAGHKRPEVTEDYSHVVNFEAARKRIEEIAMPN
ncbi:MAG: tyrosine-type recombinase/integrase [Spirochaetia bacterium]|jgi:integrase